MLPLYLLDQPQKTDQGNAGLYFQRFYNGYKPDGSFSEEDGAKNNWLRKFHNKTGDEAALDSAAQAQYTLVNQVKGESKVFTTDWHFITGMGYSHPVENGLNWHPVYGVPYLSGAAVKGMVRAWVEEWLYKEDEEEDKKRHLLQWFGSEDKSSSAIQAGDLIFFDALPINPVHLMTDIMTPHMGKWYEKGGEITSIESQPDRIPADWHSPIPIPFLVVKSASYLFSVAPRNTKIAKTIDISAVMECLENALNFLGAGAKTATGYGQMSFDRSANTRLTNTIKQLHEVKQEKERIGSLSPLEEKIDSIIKNDQNPAVALLNKLDQGEWSDISEQQVIANKVRELFHEKGDWNPGFTGSNKRKLQKRDRCLKVLKYLGA